MKETEDTASIVLRISVCTNRSHTTGRYSLYQVAYIITTKATFILVRGSVW